MIFVSLYLFWVDCLNLIYIIFIIVKKLDGKVVVVIGVFKGIGVEIVKYLVGEGVVVVVNYVFSKEGVDCVVDEIVSMGGKAIVV